MGGGSMHVQFPESVARVKIFEVITVIFDQIVVMFEEIIARDHGRPTMPDMHMQRIT